MICDANLRYFAILFFDNVTPPLNLLCDSGTIRGRWRSTGSTFPHAGLLSLSVAHKAFQFCLHCHLQRPRLSYYASAARSWILGRSLGSASNYSDGFVQIRICNPTLLISNTNVGCRQFAQRSSDPGRCIRTGKGIRRLGTSFACIVLIIISSPNSVNW